MLAPLLEALLALFTRPSPAPVPCPVAHDDNGKGKDRQTEQHD